MPESNTQLIDPEGQAVMEAFVTAGADPETAYNATQGIRKMSGDEAIAEIRAFRREFQTLSTDLQTLTADLQALTADVQTLTVDVQAQQAQLAAMDDRMNAFSTQLDIVGWAVMATFAMVMLLTATGILAMLGLGSRRRKSKKRGKRRAGGRADSKNAS